MDVDVTELVRSIAQEVIKQLHQQDGKDCILVFAERECSLADKVKECIGEDVELCFFGENVGDRTICRYILPSLCVCEMGDLATGKAHGAVMTEVLRQLLLGNEVEVLEFGYKAYSETASGPLYSLYESYEETLAGFGLKEFQPKRPDTIRFRKNLVTENVVNDAHGQEARVLMVPVAAQITPLAAEAAKNLNISIQKCL